MIGFFPIQILNDFECYATMPMLADAHISSLGYLWRFINTAADQTADDVFRSNEHEWHELELQSTPDNSNPQGKSKIVRVIGSSKKMARSMEKTVTAQ